jgi:hypothetical protein
MFISFILGFILYSFLIAIIFFHIPISSLFLNQKVIMIGPKLIDVDSAISELYINEKISLLSGTIDLNKV